MTTLLEIAQFSPIRQRGRWVDMAPCWHRLHIPGFGLRLEQAILAAYGRAVGASLASGLATLREGYTPPQPRPASRCRAPGKALYQQLLREECAHYSVSFEIAVTRKRTRRHAVVRQRVFYRLRNMGYSLPGIGKSAGGFDHTSALHGARKIEMYNSITDFVRRVSVEVVAL